MLKRHEATLSLPRGKLSIRSFRLLETTVFLVDISKIKGVKPSQCRKDPQELHPYCISYTFLKVLSDASLSHVPFFFARRYRCWSPEEIAEFNIAEACESVCWRIPNPFANRISRSWEARMKRDETDVWFVFSYFMDSFGIPDPQTNDTLLP